MQLTRSEKVVLGQLNTVLSYGANFNILPIKYSDVPVRQEEISCILILLLKLEFLKNYKGRRGKHENDLSHTETEYYFNKYKDILTEWYELYPEYNLLLELDTYHSFDSEFKIITRQKEETQSVESLRINTPIDENVPTYLVYRHIELRDLIVKHLGYSLFDSIVGETFYNNEMAMVIKSYMLIHVSTLTKFKRLYVLKSSNYGEVIIVRNGNHCLDMNTEWYASKSALVKELDDSISKVVESLQNDLKEIKGYEDELKTETGN